MAEEGRTRPRRVRVLVLVGSVVLLGGLLLVLALTTGGSTGGAASPSPDQSSPGVSPSPSPSPDEDAPEPEPVPTATPDEPPGEPAPDDDGPAAPGTDHFADPTEDAVPLDAAAPFATDVTARLESIEAVSGEGVGPGEVSGPAVRLTIELVNDTAAEVALNRTVVNVYGGADRSPAEPLSGSGARWFEGALAPGDRATAVYVFAVPADRRDPLQVTVSYDPGVPTVLFEGAGPMAS